MTGDGSGSAERLVRDACAVGAVADLTGGAPDGPIAGAAGETVDAAGVWGPDRRVTADLVQELLTAAVPERVHPRGVRIRGARITGVAAWDWQRFPVPLELLDCVLDAPLLVDQAQLAGLILRRCLVPAIAGRELRSDHSLVLAGSRVPGGVELTGARIAGDLDVGGAELGDGAAAPEYALAADRVEIAGDVFLGDGFRSHGEVRLQGARIHGHLTCEGSSLTNLAGPALRLDRAEVAGGVLLRGGFTATGEVRLPGSRIGGTLNCTGAILTNPGGTALSASGAVVAGGIYLRSGFTATGDVRIRGARISGQLVCEGGTFGNAAGPALRLDRTEVSGDLLLGGGFRAAGEVRMPAVSIGGELNCVGGRFTGDSGRALHGEGMRVAGSLRLRGLAAPVSGVVNLTRAVVGELDDDEASWPAPGNLRITGFVYDRLSDTAPTQVAKRRAWIRRQPEYHPQPYQQLAQVYRRAGHVDEAQRIGIAQHDDARTDGDVEGWGRLWNWLLGWSVGHGYRPGRMIWVLLVLFTATAIPVYIGAQHDTFAQVGNTPNPAVTASHCGPGYPCLSWPAYALEDITPILNLHQAENWQPDGSRPWGWLLRGWLQAATVAGWLATTLLIAAVSGLTQRE